MLVEYNKCTRRGIKLLKLVLVEEVVKYLTWSLNLADVFERIVYFGIYGLIMKCLRSLQTSPHIAVWSLLTINGISPIFKEKSIKSIIAAIIF